MELWVIFSLWRLFSPWGDSSSLYAGLIYWLARTHYKNFRAILSQLKYFSLEQFVSLTLPRPSIFDIERGIVIV